MRQRIEMVALSDIGWSAPRIADHLGRHPQTVRDLLRSFNARGVAALRPLVSGPAPDPERRGRVVSALSEMLGERRAWTSRQLADALAGRGIGMGPMQVRRCLNADACPLPPYRLGLREAVEEAFSGYGRRLPRKTEERLRPAV